MVQRTTALSTSGWFGELPSDKSSFSKLAKTLEALSPEGWSLEKATNGEYVCTDLKRAVSPICSSRPKYLRVRSMRISLNLDSATREVIVSMGHMLQHL